MASEKKQTVWSRIAAALLSAAVLGSGLVGLGSLPYTAVTVKAAVAEEAPAATVNYGLASTSQEGVILHCWNWSYKNIKKYMKDIAAAGYTSIQTSPVQQPKDYFWKGVAYGNVGIPNGTGGEDGNWWKAYQPVTFSICDNGHTWYGTKQEFKEMCAEAEKYGVKVIVDIVANHMGNIQGYKIGSTTASLEENQKAVMGDISPQVGEFWRADMLTDPSYWHISTSWTHTSDGRFDVTQGNMGMPDLNTGDTKVQQMVLGLLKECIDCGADGFRFDAAKHIETPADNASFASDFWNVVLDGARSYYKQVNGYDGVYFYGEVLNRLDDTNAENYYLSKMSLTDNSTSDNLRNSVMNGSVSALATSNYCGYVHGKGNRTVLWPESHDTYMGGGSSYDANDTVIKQTWAIMASRKDSTALFFARPYYSKDILAGDVSKARQSTTTILEKIDEQTQLGDVGTLTWADPAVVAANRFRNAFIGQSEKLGSSDNTAYNVRGKTGIVIVRGGGAGKVSISGTGMTDGTYTDQVGGGVFTVSGGTITGTVKNADGIAVVYNPSVNYGPVNPDPPTVIRLSAATAGGSTVFTTDTTSVTIKATGTSKVTYTTSEGASGSFTGTSKTITLGQYTATGDTVDLTITGTAADGITKTKTFQFTKKVISSEYPSLSKGGVVFDNSSYEWSKVYCYAYNDSGTSVINNGAWPGVLMSEEQNGFWSYEFTPTLTGTVNVIFSNGSGTQVPGSGQAGLTMAATDKKLFTGGALTVLPETVKTLTLTLKSSAQTAALGQTITLTAAGSNNTGTVKYTYMVNDGTTLKSAVTDTTCTWTPSKEGTYIVAVRAQDNNLSITKTLTIAVGNVTSLTSTSSLSADTMKAGGTVTVKGSAVGGTTPYQFAFYSKAPGDSAYTTLKDFSTTASYSYSSTAVGTHRLLVKVKDQKGATAQTELELTVTKAENSLANNSTLSSYSIALGNSTSVKGAASGGNSPYQYVFYYKLSSASSFTQLKALNTTSTATFKPSEGGTYTIRTKVKDNNGNWAVKDLTLQVAGNGPVNTTTLSAVNIAKGSSITVKGAATGGTSPYQYAFYYKLSSDSSFTQLKALNSTATATFKPTHSGTYTIRTKVKDNSGTWSVKDLTLKVLANTTTISAANIAKGDSVTINGAAAGGTKSYQYVFYYKRSTEDSFTQLKALNTTATATFKPTLSGTYTIRTKVKDKNGIWSVKDLTLKVLANTTTISAANVVLGNSVKITGSAAGGTSPYQYVFYYKKSTADSFTQLKALNSTATATFRPSASGTYTIRTKVKDKNGIWSVKDLTLRVTLA